MKKPLELKMNAWELVPYIYFIGLASFWLLMDLFSVQNFSYVAFGLLIGLIIQAVIQNRIVGTGLGILATIVSLYVFLAVLSEFNDFEVVNSSAIQLISVGSVLSLTGVVVGVTLTVSNVKKLGI